MKQTVGLSEEKPNPDTDTAENVRQYVEQYLERNKIPNRCNKMDKREKLYVHAYNEMETGTETRKKKYV